MQKPSADLHAFLLILYGSLKIFAGANYFQEKLFCRVQLYGT